MVKLETRKYPKKSVLIRFRLFRVIWDKYHIFWIKYRIIWINWIKILDVSDYMDIMDKKYPDTFG